LQLDGNAQTSIRHWRDGDGRIPIAALIGAGFVGVTRLTQTLPTGFLDRAYCLGPAARKRAAARLLLLAIVSLIA
jgi:hypothetical protein